MGSCIISTVFCYLCSYSTVRCTLIGRCDRKKELMATITLRWKEEEEEDGASENDPSLLSLSLYLDWCDPSHLTHTDREKEKEKCKLYRMSERDENGFQLCWLLLLYFPS